MPSSLENRAELLSLVLKIRVYTSRIVMKHIILLLFICLGLSLDLQAQQGPGATPMPLSPATNPKPQSHTPGQPRVQDFTVYHQEQPAAQADPQAELQRLQTLLQSARQDPDRVADGTVQKYEQAIAEQRRLLGLPEED